MSAKIATNTSSLKQPRSFYIIFFLEMWERFGYYGLQAVLASFFVKSLGMSDAESFTIFGAFSAMVYGFVAIGGYIGDKVLGTKRTIVLGALTMMTGYILIGMATLNQSLVYIALAFVAVGNGLFKANPSSLLSKLYEKDDPRLDGAFTLYYMSINIGSFISMVLVPILSGIYGLNVGFYVCAVGLLISLSSFIFFRHLVKDIDSPVGLAPLSYRNLAVVLVGEALAIGFATYMLQNITVAHWLLLLIGVTVFGIFFKEVFKSRGIERSKMIAAFILMIQAVVFFTLYQQMPTSLNFFAIKNVEHSILGINISNPEAFQALNPFWITVASPLFAYLFAHYGKQGRDLSMPAKFALGMVLCAISFLILPLGAYFANSQGIVSVWWLVGSYFFQSVGELLISGLGLSMVAKLVPQRMVGFIMGAWFLTTAASGVIGAWVATLTAAPKGVTDPLQTLPIYSRVFLQIGEATAVIALIMILTVPVLRRMIEGSSAKQAAAGTSEQSA
ncbi:POT family proton-dependent oligopeptide transporter [Desulfohalotomaculum tongense]|uniref:oligopeptide:H+ symporter n=1 Tax=Desulforadius tongensis TaxID=1216062 RepID=UPI001A9C7099|nr:oligopeptide:H+ symporter [Desulforadius tongensis]MBM7853911.1 POT family proton-dependent oligopeptide transporter [Desulforadius tongensis]